MSYQNGKPMATYSGRIKSVNEEGVLVAVRRDEKAGGLEEDIEFSLAQVEAGSPISGADVVIESFRNKTGKPIDKIYIFS
ncbi:MAG: hypothetical protein AABW58_04645 [Nanoarchaeota archaeon]